MVKSEEKTMSKYCSICGLISYDDEKDCDCMTPQKIADRETWQKQKEAEHIAWENDRGQSKKKNQNSLK